MCPVLRDTEMCLRLWLCLKLCLGRSGSGKGEALLSHGVQCGAPACRYLCSLGLGHPATFPSAAPSWTAALEPFFSQTPKGRVGDLPTTSGGKRFQLWALGLFCTERHLAKRLKNNSFYPFIQQQPNVFVLEYYLDTLWKGTLLFVVCLLLVSFGFVSQVQKQETWGFPACGVVVGLWLMISSLPRRRLVLNHTRGTYHFSVQGRTVCQGPMHLVYVRLALSSDGEARRGHGRLWKVLLPVGSMRPQAGAAGAGAAVGALRGGSCPNPPWGPFPPRFHRRPATA
ncbi:cation channel sperm-associated auxiliary subunit TMEM249 isoform X3 [Herpailurus yagouaroundi]|uniref:cation channel sperm-associated auxiliary subunit TMEM249 isoform X3 n=1 Tax=Herpailurus yagouaroundi TaxID=1608482 RepID=UPI001AD6BFCE|nr:transmembrane protein 249 isoform X3 [Puma yagouaroundi]